MKRTIVFAVAGVSVLVILALGVNFGLQYLARTSTPEVPISPVPATQPSGHITATLFYGSADGVSLAPVRLEVPLAEGAVALGRQIVRAQLQPPPAGYLRVIPPGTMLKAFYLTNGGDAFVDVSSDISRKHPGGTQAELLTVYAIVNAVTANLQGVQRVQILIDGKEADSIAGHVDLRRPLERDTSLVQQPQEPRQSPSPAVQ